MKKVSGLNVDHHPIVDANGNSLGNEARGLRNDVMFADLDLAHAKGQRTLKVLKKSKALRKLNQELSDAKAAAAEHYRVNQEAYQSEALRDAKKEGYDITFGEKRSSSVLDYVRVDATSKIQEINKDEYMPRTAKEESIAQIFRVEAIAEQTLWENDLDPEVAHTCLADLIAEAEKSLKQAHDHDSYTVRTMQEIPELKEALSILDAGIATYDNN